VSDLYELGFTIELKQNLSQEVQETLTYMTRSGGVSDKQPLLKHPFFQIEGFTTEWTYLISNPRDDEEILEKICGSVFADNQLTFRGVINDDPFWNTWSEFSDWLFSISSSTGLIGYYRNIIDDEPTTLVAFQPQGVCELKCEKYSEFEELQNLIIDNLESSEFEAPIIQERQADSSIQNLGKLAKAKGYLVMRVPGLGIIELLRPSTTNPGQMISVARSTSEDEIRQVIEQ
jgi:hypothetical protein